MTGAGVTIDALESQRDPPGLGDTHSDVPHPGAGVPMMMHSEIP